MDLTPFASRQSATSGSGGSGSTAMELTSSSTPDRRYSWPFEEACLKREPVFIESLKGLSDDLELRGWNELPRHAVVVPIFAEAGQNVPQAVLVVGINTRGCYDALYKTFLQLVARHTAIGLLAVCVSLLPFPSHFSTCPLLPNNLADSGWWVYLELGIGR